MLFDMMRMKNLSECDGMLSKPIDAVNAEYLSIE